MSQQVQELVHAPVGFAEFLVGPGVPVRFLTSFTFVQTWACH